MALVRTKILGHIFFSLIVIMSWAVDAKESNNLHVVFDNKGYEAALESLKPLVSFNINKEAILDVDGKLALLVPEKNKLIYKHGDIKTVVNESVKNKELPSAKGVWLHKSPMKLYALWWTKGVESKKLRVKFSSDNGKTFSEKAVVIAKKGVLPKIYTADNGADGIAVAYISERSSGYQLYFNRSLDGGKTWYKDDVRINDLYTRVGKVDPNKKDEKLRIGSHVSDPFITYLDNKLILVYQESIVKDKKVFLRIVSKTSKDFGDTWEEKEIFSYPGVNPQEMKVDRLGDELFVSVFIPKKGVHTFLKHDSQDPWNSLGVLPNTDGLNFASVMQTVKSKNKEGIKRIITFTSKSLYQQNHVKFYEIDNDTSGWRDITAQITRKPIIPDESAEGYAYSKLQFSDLAVLNDNFIIAAWEDHTYLVPTVVYNFSIDGGLTWNKSPLFINYPAKNVQKSPTFLEGSNRLWLLSSQFDLSLKAIANPPLYGQKVAEVDDNGLIHFYLPTEQLGKHFSEKEKMALLKKREKEYWDYKTTGQHGKTYPYLEPIYRSIYSEDMFARSKSLITYVDYKLGKVKEKVGNVVIMETTITFVLGGTPKGGISTDDGKAKTAKMNVRWGWFHDNWYVMPDALFDRRRDL